mmetsp:Transcript_14796/g.39563  ORF Transcript_14796/g.39563 Transcript_14796/m.39563 type:complete len:276 (-) Transcript_14796:279-1106(-)
MQLPESVHGPTISANDGGGDGGDGGEGCSSSAAAGGGTSPCRSVGPTCVAMSSANVTDEPLRCFWPLCDSTDADAQLASLSRGVEAPVPSWPATLSEEPAGSAMLGSESRASKSPESSMCHPHACAIDGETGGGRTPTPGEAPRELAPSAAGTLTLSPETEEESATFGPASVSSCVSVRICSALRSTRLAVWRCASSSSACSRSCRESHEELSETAIETASIRDVSACESACSFSLTALSTSALLRGMNEVSELAIFAATYCSQPLYSVDDLSRR